jgi:pimeloyl-ACP methyl ester carboxylesterase
MRLIKTKSFALAINENGNIASKNLVIILPGRLDSKDYDCFNSHLAYFASKGFYAISMDPPGTWDSPGGTGLFTMTNYLKATNELIEYFGNKPTLLLGHSRGGAVANIVGTNNPHVVGIITLMASFGEPSPPSEETIKDGFYTDFRDMPPGTVKSVEQKKFIVPLTYFEDGKKYNDAEELKKCTKPKLIFYATKDKYNSPEFVKEVFNTLQEPKTLYELKCTHDYRYYPNIVEEVNGVIDSFVSKYIF